MIFKMEKELAKYHFCKAVQRKKVADICREAGFNEAADFFTAAAIYSIAEGLRFLAAASV